MKEYCLTSLGKADILYHCINIGKMQFYVPGRNLLQVLKALIFQGLKAYRAR